jgi:toxin HigB-1
MQFVFNAKAVGATKYLRLTYRVKTAMLSPMILSYRDKKTEAFGLGQFVKAFQGFEDQAERRLANLSAAPDLATLRNLPSSRLEALRGNRTNQYSIRINAQWRICFEWPDGASGPSEVEIVDYHR